MCDEEYISCRWNGPIPDSVYCHCSPIVININRYFHIRSLFITADKRHHRIFINALTSPPVRTFPHFIWHFVLYWFMLLLSVNRSSLHGINPQPCATNSLLLVVVALNESRYLSISKQGSVTFSSSLSTTSFKLLTLWSASITPSVHRHCIINDHARFHSCQWFYKSNVPQSVSKLDTLNAVQKLNDVNTDAIVRTISDGDLVHDYSPIDWITCFVFQDVDLLSTWLISKRYYWISRYTSTTKSNRFE